MKRSLVRIFTVLFLACAQLPVHAQTGKDMAELEEAFLNEAYQQVIDRIDAVEKKLGRSPRLESIRAQSYAALDKPEFALEALLRYEQMVGKRLAPDHPGHAEMLALKEWARSLTVERVREFEEGNRKYALDKAREWDQEFEKLRKYAAERAAKTQKLLDERIEREKSRLSNEELRYLVLTKTGEHFSRIDVRSLDFPDLKIGIFSLGLSQAEFESWLVAQVRELGGEDASLRHYVSTFRPMYEEKQVSGKAVQAFTFYDLHREFNFDSFNRFLNASYSGAEAERLRHKVESLANQVSGRTSARELYALAPDARICFVSEVTFFEGKAYELSFTCRFPPTWNDLESMQKGVVARYGPPDSFEDKPFQNSRYLFSQYVARNDAAVLVSSIEGRDHKGHRTGPLSLTISPYYKSLYYN